MELISPAFDEGEKIPKKYTCEGDNINPPLEISGVPENAESLVLIIYDSDIPHEFKKQLNIHGWDHWTVWNISSDVKIIEENSVPEGAVQGKHTGGSISYTGPCPPNDKKPTEHRYFFWLYALDTKLYLPEGSTKKQVEEAMKNHVIEKAELMGLYEKERHIEL